MFESFESLFVNAADCFLPAETTEEEGCLIVCCGVVTFETFHQRVSGASSPCAKSFSRWDTLRRLTRQGLHHGGAFGVLSPEVRDPSLCRVRRGSYPPTEPLSPPRHAASAAARPRPPRSCEPMSSCQVCRSRSRCRVCYTNLVWESGLNRSAPSVSGSVLIGKKRSRRSVRAPSPPLY